MSDQCNTCGTDKVPLRLGTCYECTAVEGLLSKPDDEILAEVIAAGLDPAEEATKGRALFEAVMRERQP